ncbi:MAG: hypothetical protein JSV94_00405 [Methanobacteriota archaeon]|nr:MAG: hypothetical protein JSV94_00405 [Euryarchaeota archaeon]
MDFVISKAALSICALLVASVLGQTLSEPPTSSELRGLEAVADHIDDLLSVLAGVDCEITHAYDVPSLSTGSTITLIFRTGGVEISSEDAQVTISSRMRIHLWEWNGTELNRSIIDGLDTNHDSLVVVTGDQLRIFATHIPVQSVSMYMTFVRLA